MPSTRPVVFDLDLTLLRTATEEAWMEVLADVGVTGEEAVAAYRAGIGQAGIVTVQHALPEQPELHDEVMERYEHVSTAAPAVPMPGVHEMIEQLALAGHELYISTGASPQKVEKYLDQFGWNDTFTVAQGSADDMPKGLAHLQRFADHAGVTLAQFAADALTVGDGAGEMRYGAQAEIPYRCAYMHPNAPEDLPGLVAAGANLAVDHLRDIPEIAQAANPLTTRFAVN